MRSPAEKELLQLLRSRSLQRAPEGRPFRLASGSTSNHYIDARLTTLHPRGACLAGQVLCQRIWNLDVDAIGGPEVGAVPLITSMIVNDCSRGRIVQGFWVRREEKRHGMGRLIEGGLVSGSRAVIVDDVVTRGESVLRAIMAVRDASCLVVAVLALVDRLAGAGELFRQHGIEDYRPVFTIRDLGIDP